MKVVIVNHSDTQGGASVVSVRLLDALRDQGVDAKMLVIHKSTDHKYIEALGPEWRVKACFLYEHAQIYLHNGFSRDTLFKVSIANCGMSIHSHPWVKEADVVLLNWVNQGMLSLREIAKIKTPVVWTLHDMWCMTGVCHHAGQCTRFIEECGDCPLLNKAASPRDLSHSVYSRKQKLYGKKPIQFVAVSHWLEDKCRESSLLKDSSVKVIPNAFPVYKFSSTPSRSRIHYGLPENKPLIIMGAARLDDPIKGLDTAIAALNQLIDTDAVAVFFGAIKHQDALKELRLPYIHVGTVTDHQTLNDLYAHASVVLSTSRYETLPGTLIEGMAAGCVPVTFGRGGQGDIVRHGITGYIAKYGDAEDVAEGIRFALSGKVDLGRMRAEIEHKFAAATVARKYIELFEEVMNK